MVDSHRRVVVTPATGNNGSAPGVADGDSRSGTLSGRVRLRFTSKVSNEDPAATRERDKTLKTGIHPEYVTTEVTCNCGNTFSTRSTQSSGSIHVEICSNCHPFYTGK